MSTSKISIKLAATILFVLGTFAGCESPDGGSTHVTSNVYYGVGFYDPWYHGDYDNDYNVVVTPPDRPDRPGARPEHPIARPPGVSERPPTASQRPSGASERPSARPMPSIPSTPRPAPRGGGGRRR